MKNLLILLFLTPFLGASQNKILHKTKVIQVDSTAWYDSTQVQHSYTSTDGTATGAAAGAIFGSFLFGGLVAVAGGALIGASANTTHSTQTWIEWEKHPHPGWRVHLSNGLTYETKSSRYYVGQIIVYE